MTPQDISPDSFVKAIETSDEISRVEDTLSSRAPKSESRANEPQSPSGTKCSPNLVKTLSPLKYSRRNAIPIPDPTENLQRTEMGPWSHGLGSTGKAPISDESAQPEPKSLPRQTSLVAKTLANDLGFIQAGFQISRFITAVVDTEADHLNTN
jgi:hypothetical protein